MTQQETRCTLVSRGVEVVTSRDHSGVFISEIHGGDLDGETFKADPWEEIAEAHERACMFAGDLMPT